MTTIIEKGTADDIDELDQLYRDLNDHLSSTTNYPGWKKDIYPARDTAETGVEEGSLYVLRINDRIVGTVILRHTPEEGYSKADWKISLDDEEVMVVYTLAVHPLFLHQGIGKQLLEFAVEFGRAHGARAIRLDVYDKNIPAIQLYQSHGFEYIDTVDLGYSEYGLDGFELYQMLL